jgi:hypothetical protein
MESGQESEKLVPDLADDQEILDKFRKTLDENQARRTEEKKQLKAEEKKRLRAEADLTFEEVKKYDDRYKDPYANLCGTEPNPNLTNDTYWCKF